MNRKIVVLAVALLAMAMLVTPATACVHVRREVAFVEFRVESWPNLDDLGEDRLIVLDPATGTLTITGLNAWGNEPLIDGRDVVLSDDLYSGRGGVRLTIGMGRKGYTLIGDVTQLIVESVTPGYLPDYDLTKTYATEEWTFTVTEVESGKAPAGAVGSTLDLSAKWQRGWGLCRSTDGTGIFEDARFTGIFAASMTAYGEAIYKVQEGCGVITMFD